MARVSAINDDGISKISRIGGEAFIPIKPTAPKELKRIESDCILIDDTNVQVGFSWEDPTNFLASSVIAYKIWWNQGPVIDKWVETDLAVNTNSYVKSGLTPGLVYKFKVQGRNVLEYGMESSELSLLAASLPAAPARPSISRTDNNKLEIDWEVP